MPEFTIQTKLASDTKRLSDDLLCMAGVNYELGPWLKMTAPTHWFSRPLDSWPRGRVLFTSRILLFGFIPIDWHHFKINAANRHSFREESSSLISQTWRHERNLEQDGNCCLITDKVRFKGRLRLSDRLLAPIYRRVFAHRHKRLLAKYSA